MTFFNMPNKLHDKRLFLVEVWFKYNERVLNWRVKQSFMQMSF